MRRPAADVSPPTDRNLAFLQVLWAVDHGMHAISKRMEAEHDVTGPQRLVIRMVGEQPDISAGELAEALRLHPSTITGILQRLEARGRIERHTDPSDRRRALFRLTDEGKRIRRLRSGTLESVVDEVLATAPPEQVQAARELLGALSRALDAG